MKNGVLFLAHGSRREAGNEEIRNIVHKVKAYDPHNRAYQLAFLAYGQPDISQSVTNLVKQNVQRIITIPLFLAAGKHLWQDIPHLLKLQQHKYPHVEFVQGKHIGLSEMLPSLLLNLISELEGDNTKLEDYFTDILWDPQTIEQTSMADIDRYIAGLSLNSKEISVVKRIIHTSGDPSLACQVKFHPRALTAGLEAIRGGAEVFTDVNMVRVGINQKRLSRYGGKVNCAVDQPEVAQAAQNWGITRSAAAMRLYGSRLNNQLVAIGNAPTALFEVLRMAKEKTIRPALIVGTPVGFVGAAESKELLTKFDIPYITLPGTRGGSPLAVAIVNALIYLLEEDYCV